MELPLIFIQSDVLQARRLGERENMPPHIQGGFTGKISRTLLVNPFYREGQFGGRLPMIRRTVQSLKQFTLRT